MHKKIIRISWTVNKQLFKMYWKNIQRFDKNKECDLHISLGYTGNMNEHMLKYDQDTLGYNTIVTLKVRSI